MVGIGVIMVNDRIGIVINFIFIAGQRLSLFIHDRRLESKKPALADRLCMQLISCL
jgi:hypothetical protein